MGGILVRARLSHLELFEVRPYPILQFLVVLSLRHKLNDPEILRILWNLVSPVNPPIRTQNES